MHTAQIYVITLKEFLTELSLFMLKHFQSRISTRITPLKLENLQSWLQSTLFFVIIISQNITTGLLITFHNSCLLILEVWRWHSSSNRTIWQMYLDCNFALFKITKNNCLYQSSSCFWASSARSHISFSSRLKSPAFSSSSHFIPFSSSPVVSEMFDSSP